MADDRTYIRVHDGLDEHPKVAGLSDAAFRLLVSAWCYCSRNLTDGRITDAIWKKRGTPKTRRELIDADLATQRDGFVEMHDYLEHQRSAAEVAELKRKRSEAGSKGGKAKANARALAKQVPEQVLKQTASKTVPSTEADTEQVLALGGNGTEVTTRDPNDPPRCPQHSHLRREDVPNCRPCGRLREQWEAERALDDAFGQRPAWCGRCDEWTRQVETDRGMARCPACHPLAEVSA